MIKLENYEVVGWEHAIRGMRNPKNSWNFSDSGWDAHIPPIELRNQIDWGDYAELYICIDADSEYSYDIGPKDRKLMMQLAKGGPVHAKYRRMIVVYVDITAPLYWWKEFDTYKVGTVANSCSTMHKIADKEFTLDDFSHEHLNYEDEFTVPCANSNSDDRLEDEYTSITVLELIIEALNHYRKLFLKTGDKKYWWQMIQLLPSSYNQKRTVMLSYEVLANMHQWRKKIPHKLDEWLVFGDWIESLPYSEIITCKSGPDVLYLCDEKACDPCNNMDCSHTSNVAHARNFKEMHGAYWETESVSDCDIEED